MRSQRKHQDNVISFSQPAEFYFRRGEACQSSGNLIDALAFFRRAVLAEPDNMEYRVSEAAVLTEMGCYEQSNRLLWGLLQRGQAVPADFFYGMGCNFIGMHEYELAMDSFKRFLGEAKDGPLTDEVFDLMAALEQEGGTEEIFGEDTDDDESMKAHNMAQEALELLEQGNASEALKLMEQAHALSPDATDISNNLMLTYFCSKQYDDAVKISKNVLEKDPSNIHTHCNLALLYRQTGDEQGLKHSIDLIKKAESTVSEDISKIGVTLCELGHPKEARKYFRRLVREKPYNPKYIHQAAVNAYQLGEYAQAADYWREILKMLPDNSVAAFFLAEARAAAEGAVPRKGLFYHFQVPFDEIIRRLGFISDCSKLSDEELKNRDNTELWSTLLWALEYNDETIKRVAINLMPKLDSKIAQEKLRDMLLRRDQSDELKQEALALLKDNGAKEPFIALMKDGLVEVHVSLLGLGEKMPKECAKVMEILITSLAERREDKVVPEALEIWEFYLQTFIESVPRIKSPEAYAAALEYIAKKRLEMRVTQKQVCINFDVTLSRLVNALADIEARVFTDFDD